MCAVRKRRSFPEGFLAGTSRRVGHNILDSVGVPWIISYTCSMDYRIFKLKRPFHQMGRCHGARRTFADQQT